MYNEDPILTIIMNGYAKENNINQNKLTKIDILIQEQNIIRDILTHNDYLFNIQQVTEVLKIYLQEIKGFKFMVSDAYLRTFIKKNLLEEYNKWAKKKPSRIRNKHINNSTHTIKDEYNLFEIRHSSVN